MTQHFQEKQLNAHFLKIGILQFTKPNGVEALDAVHAGLAEVLFLDLQMPQMDGFEVLKELQQEHQKTIVIVISADIQPAAQALVSSMGAFRFLQKPLKAAQLRETLLDVGLL